MNKNLASFSVVLEILIFLYQFVFSVVQRSRKIALNLPLVFVLLRCFLRRYLEIYEQTTVLNVVVTVTRLQQGK